MAQAMAELSDQPIVNRVAQSSLVTLDLGDFYPKGTRLELDIAPWLYEGLLVKETEFRAHLAALDLTAFSDAWVRIFCSADSLLPAWTFPLVSLTLAPVCRQSFVGSWTEFDQWAIASAIAHWSNSVQLPTKLWRHTGARVRETKGNVQAGKRASALQKMRTQASR